jgi:hypothetical protein
MIDWKTRTLVITALVGAAAGVVAGLLYIREVEETGEEPPRPAAKSLVPIGLTALGLIRQVASLAEPKE